MRLARLILPALAMAACREPAAPDPVPVGGSVVVSGQLLKPDGDPALGVWGTATARLISRPDWLGSFRIEPDYDGRFSVTIGPFSELRSVAVTLEIGPPSGDWSSYCLPVTRTTFDLGPLLLSSDPQPLTRNLTLKASGQPAALLRPGIVCGFGVSADRYIWSGLTLAIESVDDSVRGFWTMDHPSAVAARGALGGAVVGDSLALRLEQDGAYGWCEGGFVVQIALRGSDTLTVGTFEGFGECEAWDTRFEFVEFDPWQGRFPYPEASAPDASFLLAADGAAGR